LARLWFDLIGQLMSSNQAILSAVIGILFLLIVLNYQLIKPVEIKRNISTKIEWNPFSLSITRTLIGRVPNISGTLPKNVANTGTEKVLVVLFWC
jgi:hypothetical protein